MEKMLVAVFDSEESAFNGLTALKELHGSGDVSLFATSVISKDGEGEIAVKQTADTGPLGTGAGMLTGAMVGMFGGPAGMVVGMTLGGLTGALFDLNKAGFDVGFLEEVSEAMSEGKVAVIAHLDEGWTTPVDSRLEDELGGLVFRKLRSEVVEDQISREAAAIDAELDELDAELEEATDEAKEKIQAQIDKTKEKVRVAHNAAKERLADSKAEFDAKLEALEEQLKGASDRRKAKIEKRIAEAKEDFAARSAKLETAAQLMKDAFSDTNVAAEPLE